MEHNKSIPHITTTLKPNQTFWKEFLCMSFILLNQMVPFGKVEKTMDLGNSEVNEKSNLIE